MTGCFSFLLAISVCSRSHVRWVFAGRDGRAGTKVADTQQNVRVSLGRPIVLFVFGAPTINLVFGRWLGFAVDFSSIRDICGATRIDAASCLGPCRQSSRIWPWALLLQTTAAPWQIELLVWSSKFLLLLESARKEPLFQWPYRPAPTIAPLLAVVAPGFPGADAIADNCHCH